MNNIGDAAPKPGDNTEAAASQAGSNQHSVDPE
jgi:hypothetical protein